MNGKVATNIDEEALFEMLATANFGGPAVKSGPRRAAAVIDSSEDATRYLDVKDEARRFSTFPGLPSSRVSRMNR